MQVVSKKATKILGKNTSVDKYNIFFYQMFTIFRLIAFNLFSAFIFLNLIIFNFPFCFAKSIRLFKNNHNTNNSDPNYRIIQKIEACYSTVNSLL